MVDPIFSSRRIADRTVADRSTLGGQGRGQLWLALLQFADRKVQEVEQEGLSSRGQIQVSTQSHARGFLGHHSIRDTKMGVTGNW